MLQNWYFAEGQISSIMAHAGHPPAGSSSAGSGLVTRLQVAKAHVDFALRPTSDSFAHLCTSSARLFVDQQATWLACCQQSLAFRRRGKFEASGRALKAFVQGDTPLTVQLAKWYFGWVHGPGGPLTDQFGGDSDVDDPGRQFFNCGTLAAAVGIGLAGSSCLPTQGPTTMGTVDAVEVIDSFIQTFCDGSVPLLLSGVSYTAASVHQLQCLLQPPSNFPRKLLGRQLIRDVVSGATWPQGSPDSPPRPGGARGVKRSAAAMMHTGSSGVDALGVAAAKERQLEPPAEAAHQLELEVGSLAQSALFFDVALTDSMYFGSPPSGWSPAIARAPRLEALQALPVLFTSANYSGADICEMGSVGSLGCDHCDGSYDDQGNMELAVGLAVDPHDMLPVVSSATSGHESGGSFDNRANGGASGRGDGGVSGVGSHVVRDDEPNATITAVPEPKGAGAARLLVPDVPSAHYEPGTERAPPHHFADGDSLSEASPALLCASPVAEPVFTRWSLDVQGSSRLYVGSKLGQGTYGVVCVVPWRGLAGYHAVAVCVQKSALTVAPALASMNREHKLDSGLEVPALPRPSPLVHVVTRTVLVPPRCAPSLRLDVAGAHLAGGRRGTACAALARSRPSLPTFQMALPEPAAVPVAGPYTSTSSIRALSFEREVYVTLRRMGSHPNIVRYLGCSGFPQVESTRTVPSPRPSCGPPPHLLLEACHGPCMCCIVVLT